MLKINHAILHVLDLESGECYLSQSELDLDERACRSYVQRHLRKLCASSENRHGEFTDASAFAGEVKAYLLGQRDFGDLSVQVASWFYDELRKGDDDTPLDLLVADFTDVPSKPKAAAADASEVPFAEDVPAAPAAVDLDAAYTAKPRRRIGIVLLPRRQLFSDDMRGGEAGPVCEIVRQDSILPSPTQKVDTYALIDAADLSIEFHDVERTIAGQKAFVVSDGLLQCSSAASTKEVMDTVEKIVEQVADEAPVTVASSAAAVSRAKAYVTKHVEADESFKPEDVGREVFEDAPELAEHYERAVASEDLPHEVPVRPAVARRIAKSHRIRTDTGIEVIFPSEYAASPEYIEFVSQPDGTVSIELKGIGKIENR